MVLGAVPPVRVRHPCRRGGRIPGVVLHAAYGAVQLASLQKERIAYGRVHRRALRQQASQEGDRRAPPR